MCHRTIKGILGSFPKALIYEYLVLVFLGGFYCCEIVVGRFEIVVGRFEIVVGRCEIVVDRCGSFRLLVITWGSLWVVVDRCRSLWVVVERCGSFRLLVITRLITTHESKIMTKATETRPRTRESCRPDSF